MRANCALIQMNFSDDVAENRERLVHLIGEAAGDGAQIISLPELATSQYFCYEMRTSFMDLAETIPGPATTAVGAVARSTRTWVVLPLYERDVDGQLYNSAVVINPRGEVEGTYRKNIIPIMKFEGVEGVEKYYFRPGNLGYPVFTTDLGITIGITICYERHFPEGPRILALHGADVIFVPTATPAGSHMWEVELRAMAIANLLWVGGVNRVGRDRGTDVSDMDFYGSSLFAGPTGEVVARATTDGNEVVHATIDTDQSEKLRQEWGFFRDRRPEIYRAMCTP